MFSIRCSSSALSVITRSPFRSLRTSPTIYAQNSPAHTSDSYSKDVDASPPPDPTIHIVDSAQIPAEVQRPHEPPAGQFSQTGAKAALNSVAGNEKLQHGGRQETSHRGEGPEGKEQGGRRPEGKS
jgi:hypothetical protein